LALSKYALESAETMWAHLSVLSRRVRAIECAFGSQHLRLRRALVGIIEGPHTTGLRLRTFSAVPAYLEGSTI